MKLLRVRGTGGSLQADTIMIRSLCWMSLVLTAFAIASTVGGEAQAQGPILNADNTSYYGNAQFGYNNTDYVGNQEPRPLIMQDGVSHGKQWGQGHVARSVARWDDRFFPSSVNGYMTKTRCGPFSTIR